MPKYFCDYCDTYLTHDSPSVRKTHCSGRKHKENVKFYYEKWYEQYIQKSQPRGSELHPPLMNIRGIDFPPCNLPPPRGLPTGPPPVMPGLANMMMPPPNMLPRPNLPLPNVMIPPPNLLGPPHAILTQPPPSASLLQQPPPSMTGIMPPLLRPPQLKND